jgi:hypothetical protein
MKAFTSMNRKTRFNRAQSDSMIGVQQRINNNEEGITNAVTEFLNSYNKSNDDDDFYKNINNDSDHDHDSDNNHDHDSCRNYDSYHDHTPDNDHNHDGFNDNIDETDHLKNDNLDNSNTDSCSCSDDNDNDNNSNNNDMDDTTSNHINKISSFVGRQVTFNPFKNNSVRPVDCTVVADSTNLNMEQHHHHH